MCMCDVFYDFINWYTNSYTYSTEYAAVVNSEYCHDSSVTCLSWRHGTMATGSWDSTVKVCKSPSSVYNAKLKVHIHQV